MRHDVEEDFIFRLKMMVEAALGEFERGGHIVHRGGVVSLLLEEAGGRAQDFLAGILTGFLTTSEYRRGTLPRCYPESRLSALAIFTAHNSYASAQGCHPGSSVFPR